MLESDPRRRLLSRHANNPLLSAYDWPYFVNTVFNPGAIRLSSGETLLLCSAEWRTAPESHTYVQLVRTMALMDGVSIPSRP